VLTNSFVGNALRLKLHDAESLVAELNIAAATVRQGRSFTVADSMGPTGDLFELIGVLTR
jgi:5-methyltetrahydrofolate--homocysteine methyltransferase